jgi:hypothetical protein
MPAFTYNITSRENIEANQNGQFSKEQREAIAEEAHSYLKPILWVIGGALALLFTIALIIARGNLARLILSIRAAVNVVSCSVVIFGILIMVVWIGSASLRTRAQARDLAEANILSAEGEVIWRNNEYVALTVDKRRLKTPLDDWNLFALDLLPGRYRFHYLGRVGWILSAEKLSGELTNLLPPLEWAFRFTPEDLEANRRGELTERQVKMIRRDVILGLYDDPFSQFSTIWAVMGLGGLVLIAFITYWSILFMSLLTAIYLLSIAGWRLLWLRNRPLSADMAGKRVEQVEGLRRVTSTQTVRDPKTGRRREVSKNWLHAPKIKRYFKPGRRGTGFKALVMQSGIDYRVYYTPHSGDLVSLEPIQTQQSQDDKADNE